MARRTSARLRSTSGPDGTTAEVRDVWRLLYDAGADALIVQDILGGELRRALVNGESHYWNQLDDGTVIDLTRSQFTTPLTIEDEIFAEALAKLEAALKA